MHLTPTFDNVFPMDAASCLVTEIVGGLSNPQHAAQGACCLLCYGTNFIPSGAVMTASAKEKTRIAAMSKDEVKAEIVTILKPCCDTTSPATAAAAKAIPWGTLLALLLKLLEFIG